MQWGKGFAQRCRQKVGFSNWCSYCQAAAIRVELGVIGDVIGFHQAFLPLVIPGYFDGKIPDCSSIDSKQEAIGDFEPNRLELYLLCQDLGSRTIQRTGFEESCELTSKGSANQCF